MKVGCLSIRTVADESWLFLYIHSNERLSEKKNTQKPRNQNKTDESDLLNLSGRCPRCVALFNFQDGLGEIFIL